MNDVWRKGFLRTYSVQWRKYRKYTRVNIDKSYHKWTKEGYKWLPPNKYQSNLIWWQLDHYLTIYEDAVNVQPKYFRPVFSPEKIGVPFLYGKMFWMKLSLRWNMERFRTFLRTEIRKPFPSRRKTIMILGVTCKAANNNSRISGEEIRTFLWVAQQPIIVISFLWIYCKLKALWWHWPAVL